MKCAFILIIALTLSGCGEQIDGYAIELMTNHCAQKGGVDYVLTPDIGQSYPRVRCMNGDFDNIPNIYKESQAE